LEDELVRDWSVTVAGAETVSPAGHVDTTNAARALPRVDVPDLVGTRLRLRAEIAARASCEPSVMSMIRSCG
jgi:hypothetical protein